LRIESDARISNPFAIVSNQADLAGCSKIELDEIGGEIQRLTREAAGPGSNIIDEPIHVKFMNTHGPTVTHPHIDRPSWHHLRQ